MKIHSTNALERLNGEISRRADVVRISPNEAAVQKRYVSLESLALLREDSTIRLPAAPTLA